MRLDAEQVPGWPPLAWLAVCSRRSGTVRLLHGPQVEVGECFACEAVWPGDFRAGGFDRAAIVAGSGVRVRDGEVAFVSATSTTDRLHSFELPEGPLVSNSLPCLLGATGGRARLDYWRYGLDLYTIVRGLERYRRTIPTTTGPVRLTYFRNIVWNGEALLEREKPLEHPGFSSFHEYRAFLHETLAGVAHNMADGDRRHRYQWMGTLSSGYDAATVTALGAEVGCRQAICFDESRRGEPDSGEPVARALGLEPIELERSSWYRRARAFDPLPEAPFYAAMPTGEGAPLSAAREHLAGRVVLRGDWGGFAWNPRTTDVSPTVRRNDVSGLGVTEFRLHAGCIACPPAFWASRRVADLIAISRSDEMRPWVVGETYQKPISRRIVEEAGVPREAFGIRKQPGLGGLLKERDFLGPESLADYRAWVEEHSRGLVRRRRLAASAADRLGRVAAATTGAAARLAPPLRAPGSRAIRRRLARRIEKLDDAVRPFGYGVAERLYTFHWGLDRTGARYAQAARATPIRSSRPSIDAE